MSDWNFFFDNDATLSPDSLSNAATEAEQVNRVELERPASLPVAQDAMANTDSITRQRLVSYGAQALAGQSQKLEFVAA